MPSSFFTRPFGLRPTPSTCFPPPPPAKKGTIDGNFWVAPQTSVIGAEVHVHLLAHNTEGPAGQIINLVWTLPGLQQDPPNTVQDPAAIDFISHAGFTPGNYLGKVRCTWPNGQVRTFPYVYTINPIVPPGP